MTEKVRRNPYSVILLDEIEKAHPDVFNLLLQVLEDGMLTDSFGRTIDFKNTILIMTSNVGSRKGVDHKTMGFGADEVGQKQARMLSYVQEDLKKTFSPEFLNRIDDVIIFRALARNDMHAILDIMLADMNKRLANLRISFEYTDAAREKLVSVGFDPDQGARPLRRAIQRYVEDPLSDKLLRGMICGGHHIRIDDGGEGLSFEVVDSSTEGENAPAETSA
jgi:ATP-dependent Clp protease ATP-binding subunit ClpC